MSILICGAWPLVHRPAPTLGTDYTATAKLFLRDERPPVGQDRPLSMMSYTKEESYLEAQCAVLRSLDFAKRVVEGLELSGTPELGSLEREALLQQFRSRLAIRPVGMKRGSFMSELRVIDVSFTATDPEVAARVATGVCEAFIEREAEEDRAAAEGAFTFLHQEQAKLAEGLTEAEQKLRLCESQAPLTKGVQSDGAPALKGSASIALRGQVESKRQLLEALSSRMAEIMVSRGPQAARSKVVSRAVRPPLRLPTAQRKRRIGDGLAMGLILAGVLACALELLDMRVRGAEDLSRHLALPVLGRAAGGQGGSSSDVCRAVLADPESSMAEDFRRIRANLLLALRQVDWRSLAVVSTMPGEGRSTVVANLAVAMAMTGRRALIVDCDMRRPVHHQVFGLDASAGLADVLRGEVNQEEIVRETAFDGLSVMPCGSSPHTPSDLLSGEAATALSQWAGANYDVVLYDTPPLSTASDGLVVASFSDAALFVVQAGRTNRLRARPCLEELKGTGAPILGVVLAGRESSRGAVFPLGRKWG